jgi:hypothetical protein
MSNHSLKVSRSYEDKNGHKSHFINVISNNKRDNELSYSSDNFVAIIDKFDNIKISSELTNDTQNVYDKVGIREKIMVDYLSKNNKDRKFTINKKYLYEKSMQFVVCDDLKRIETNRMFTITDIFLVNVKTGSKICLNKENSCKFIKAQHGELKGLKMDVKFTMSTQYYEDVTKNEVKITLKASSILIHLPNALFLEWDTHY